MPKKISHLAKFLWPPGNTRNDWKSQAFHEMTENHDQILHRMTKVIQVLWLTLVYWLLVLNFDKKSNFKNKQDNFIDYMI